MRAGWLELDDDEDWFWFAVQQRSRVEIRSSGAVDAVGSLRDSSNREVLAGDRLGPGNFRMRADLAPGTYYVQVRSATGRVGPYLLHLAQISGSASAASEDDHPDVASGATVTLTPGSRETGKFERGADQDWFRFALSRPATISVYTTGDLRTAGEIWDQDTRQVAFDVGSGATGNFRIVAALPPGVFFVQVRSQAGITGAYQIGFDLVKADPVVLHLNRPIRFAGDAIGTVRQMAFAARPPDASRISVMVQAGFPEPLIARKFDAVLDSVLEDIKRRSNLGTCSRRLDWQFPTTLHVARSMLKVTRTLRYEQWVCLIAQTRIYADSGQVHLGILVDTDPKEGFAVTAKVTGISGFGRLTSILARLLGSPDTFSGVRDEFRLTIPIPWSATGSTCTLTKTLDRADYRFEGTEVAQSDGHIVVTATMSLASDALQAEGCLPGSLFPVL